ncbi:hypothetical protein [Burkholderia ubonensis]|uniref:hypothetical protein n=1 Tax=Burkholderia ubonensis TaxID=101571 RepID=UPI000A7AE710|nr:hypothetical protein [Burkholderia ubonensis]
MQELKQFEVVMAEFRRSRIAMRDQLREFQALQVEIAELRKRAPSDAEARRKLARLDDVMKGGGQELMSRLFAKVDDFKSKLAKLNNECDNQSDGGAAQRNAISRENRSNGKFNRTFV